MRIRKHAKISAISFSHAPIAPCQPPSLQTNVCELNRSPWDVMAFAPQSDISYPEEFQVEGEDSVTANGSGGDSVGAVESVASLNISWGEEQKEEAEDEDSQNLLLPFVAFNDAEKRDSEIGLKKEESLISCNKTDGKGWQCRREAKEGHSLCEHHLTQLRSYHSCNYSSHRKSDKVAGTTAGARRRSRGKTPKSSSEYYYYSGFGPLWGKKRNGERGEVKKREINENDGDAKINPSSSSHIILEHDDDLDDDDDSDTPPGRKRIRKPVKARSLKSLM
ncbi:hypothetical protein HHK36_027676 [Tetracentron sinense]|uniref:WRC domain-containing protein n=1 Tax=Tetracentron sinense TaxID=13715 RepID=A0A834YF92_TETSI|nr:hypothetical protein HHK36_027676 [Tetracentron sinense]